MSLCDDRGLFATDKEMARRRRAVAALRDIDAVSHKKHRSACKRINQRFLNCLKQISLLLPSALSFFAFVTNLFLAVELIILQFIFFGKGFNQFR